MKRAFLLLFLTILLCAPGRGQNNARPDSAIFSSNSNSVNSASAKLLKSLKENKDPEEIARNYYNLAQELAGAKDLSKAETYMSKAIQALVESRKTKDLAWYYRELARIQELQNKNSIASKSYEKAAELATDSLQKQLNRNDALRLQYKHSPKSELEYLNRNARILSNSNNQEEKLQNLTQLANTNIALNQNGSALNNFREALNAVDSNSEKSIQIKSGMANLLAANNDYGNAIAIQKEAVKEAKSSSDIGTQVAQLRNLSDLYLKADSTDAGLNILKDAYELAIARGNVKEAGESVKALASYYEKNSDHKKGMELYAGFVSQLDTLIARDSSLIDKSLFLINEGKISELEQQQALKDELIQRKNRYNYVLIGSVLLLSVLLALIIKAWISIKKRNKQIALQSLRREMNPHFIFNSLNSVNHFIANNNEREANKYLTSYSNLMRNIMENSNRDYVALSTEIDQLNKYLELEKLRFSDKFEYQVDIDEEINPEEVMVPNMIIQPNLENAIWHGLRYKESVGMLKLKFSRAGGRTKVIVEDNGIGLEESKKIKTKHQKLHESLGLKNVQERIKLLNNLYKSDIRFEIKEKTGVESGVIVQIEW